MSTTNFTMLARDRYTLTKQALDSLFNTETYSISDITIIDDRSDEPTSEFLRGFGCIRNYIPIGTGLLRNKVINESERCQGRGDYLYLSDNDVWFSPGWLEKLIERYEYAWTYGYRVLGAYNHPFNQPVSRIDGVYEVNHLASQSMLMKWDVWDTWGPFVETPVDKVCQSEDVAFSNKIRAAGYKVGVVSPWLVVNTGITNSFGEKIPGYEIVKSQCPPGVICE